MLLLLLFILGLFFFVLGFFFGFLCVFFLGGGGAGVKAFIVLGYMKVSLYQFSL